MDSAAGRSAEKRWMERCLQLARNGMGFVSPNPMVGAVVVKDGEIVAEGWHERFGGPHAEVNALAALQRRGIDAEGLTVVVNLEPCNYHGKTPPCADLLIRSRVKRVVVGMMDPNPKVSGGGVQALRAAGIEVNSAVLEGECRSLNRPFSKFITEGRALVTVKLAQSVDGKIAAATGVRTAITGQTSLAYAHQLRAEHDAVLVGAETVRVDDPQLTVRLVQGKNPVRIILSPHLNLPVGAAALSSSDGTRTVVVTAAECTEPAKISVMDELSRNGVDVVRLPVDGQGRFDLQLLLQRLASRNIASVLVEGGGVTVREFLRQQMADRIALFTAPIALGLQAPDGIGGDPFSDPNWTVENVRRTMHGSDTLLEGDIVYASHRAPNTI